MDERPWRARWTWRTDRRFLWFVVGCVAYLVAAVLLSVLG